MVDDKLDGDKAARIPIEGFGEPTMWSELKKDI
jgi:hypothetical protein